MQSSTTEQVSKALYERFKSVYGSKVSWFFYTAKNFPTIKGQAVKLGNKSPSRTSRLDGKQGEIKEGVWNVFWSGTPYDKSVGKIIVNNEAIESQKKFYFMTGQSVNFAYQGIADKIYERLPSDAVSGRSGRGTTFWWVFVNSPIDATIGIPTGYDFYHKRWGTARAPSSANDNTLNVIDIYIQ